MIFIGAKEGRIGKLRKGNSEVWSLPLSFFIFLPYTISKLLHNYFLFSSIVLIQLMSWLHYSTLSCRYPTTVYSIPLSFLNSKFNMHHFRIIAFTSLFLHSSYLYRISIFFYRFMKKLSSWRRLPFKEIGKGDSTLFSYFLINSIMYEWSFVLNKILVHSSSAFESKL